MIDLDAEHNNHSSASTAYAEAEFAHFDDANVPPLPEQAHIFGTLPGIAVMTFGVIAPGLLIAAASIACCERITKLILKHPLETLVECALVLLIPIANYAVWSAICKKDMRFAIRRGIMNGMAIGMSACVGAIATAAVILGYAASDELTGNPHPGAFTSIAAASWFACATAVYLADVLKKSRELRSSRLRTVLYSALGVVMAVAAFAGAEARSVCIRIAEYMATSEKQEERKAGLDFLRALNPERDLIMEGADPRTAGIPGLFIRIDNVTQRQLYFAVTGKPYRDDKSANFAAMPDDYLRKHVVGLPVNGLSLLRSQMTGSVNPESLTSTIDWIFVFKNRTYKPEEARAEFGLPEGAVISEVTLWKEGRPVRANFNASGKAAGAFSPMVAGHDAPAIVTDLGRGRALLHCYPVPAQGELKIGLKVLVPLKLHALTDASLALPRFIDANFQILNDNVFKLRAPETISLEADGIKSGTTQSGEKSLSGRLKTEVLTGPGLSVRVARPASLGPIAVKDPLSAGETYIVETIRKVAAPVPRHLVVVVDGSHGVSEHAREIGEALQKLPPQISKSIVIASDESSEPEIKPLSEGLSLLAKTKFSGGQDNLQAVVKAAEAAGESKGGAVLWIHGPQPSFNKEMYIMSPYTAPPALYELAIDNGAMDANEFFKNHREIGLFTAVPRSASIKADLERFIAKWQPGGTDFVIDLAVSKDKPAAKEGGERQSLELSALYANELVHKLVRAGAYSQAVRVAVQHRIVTPVSLASVFESDAAYAAARDGQVDSSTNSPFALRNPEAGDAYRQNASARSVASTAYLGGLRHGQAKSGTGSALMHGQQAYGNTIAFNSGAKPGRAEQTENQSSDWSASAVEQVTAGNEESNAPRISGATNGTVGPQGADATFITGVNTAGVVRVNNLANLEAMLNIFATLGMLFGLATGVWLAGTGFMRMMAAHKGNDAGDSGHTPRLAWGTALVMFGIMLPGVINWFVASARDANLFS
ncbi:MAG TPA: hypothetical protein V6D17_04565 [Candidatus Obscuribacterales bacterium]